MLSGMTLKVVLGCGNPQQKKVLIILMKGRIAFVTDEYVIGTSFRGGLGAFVFRMAKSMRNIDWEVEVFVKSYEEGMASFLHEGVLVNKVNPENRAVRVMRLACPAFVAGGGGWNITALGFSYEAAKALEKRHRERPFDIVHTTNCSASGLFIQRDSYRQHIMRLSSVRDEWMKANESWGPLWLHILAILEQKAIRKAEVVYAPSQFVAGLCSNKGIRNDVMVLRPPAFLEVEPAEQLPPGIPHRFLLHFGHICARKGSDYVARALQRALDDEPDIRVVFAGKETNGDIVDSKARLCPAAKRALTVLGAVPRSTVYRLVKESVAVVLPSLVDNLPNSALESLMLGKGVIGFATGSIDEMVVDGVNGALVAPRDTEALAAAMVAAWRGSSGWVGTAVSPPESLAELMKPDVAARSLVNAVASNRALRGQEHNDE